ncbi:MAG TPA: hypothetical protein DEQ09_11205, partial [Bacteroidales bacterium]|nr:hypothetical protein [Bacteroidales bacterium]
WDITGEEFYSTIYAIAESPVKQGVIWTGANDGPIHITTDGGGNWKNITPMDLPAGGRVQTIEASPHNPAKAYAVICRYLLNDWKPYIYRTNDYGETWTLLTDGMNGIPADCPTRVVREDPDREGLLFAGTEHGVFVSFNDGAKWYSFKQNMPDVPVTDIKIFRNDIILSTMGRSFWIMDDISPLHAYDPMINNAKITLFTPQDGFRSPERRGLYIDCYIPSDVSSASIEIRNNEGEIIREISVNGNKGLHRVMWDMRLDVKLPASSVSRWFRGPKVVPARYTAVLIVNNERISKGFDVLPDPRIIENGMTYKSYKEQFDLCMKVVRLYKKTALLIEEVDKTLDSEKNKSTDKLKSKKWREKNKQDLLKIKNQLVTNQDIRYPQPMLSDQIMYLYSMIGRSDQKPGNDAYIRFNELSGRLESIRNQFEGLVD